MNLTDLKKYTNEAIIAKLDHKVRVAHFRWHMNEQPDLPPKTS
jgi:hypothetical protein